MATLFMRLGLVKQQIKRDRNLAMQQIDYEPSIRITKTTEKITRLTMPIRNKTAMKSPLRVSRK